MAEIIRMPRLSDTMEEGNIVGWLKKEGDKVSPGDVLAEVETDKATMELESFHEGYLLHIGVKEGPVPVNAILAVIGAKGEDYKAALAKELGAEPLKTEKTNSTPTPTSNDVPPATPPLVPEVEVTTAESRIKTSPLARSMAEKAGIDIKAVTGSGDGGRVLSL